MCRFGPFIIKIVSYFKENNLLNHRVTSTLIKLAFFFFVFFVVVFFF